MTDSYENDVFPCSPEVADRYEQDILFAVDWTQQAENCAEAFEETRNPVYKELQAEAELKAKRQERIFKEITRLKLSLRK